MKTVMSKEAMPHLDPSRRLFLKRTSIGSACALASPLLASGIIAPAWARDELFRNSMREVAVQDENDLFFDLLRQASLASLSLIPYVGGVLGGIGGLLIPARGETPEQTWRRIIESINQIVDTKITEAVRALVESDLQGMTDLTKDYIKHIDAGDAVRLAQLSLDYDAIFTSMMPRFATKGQEKPLINLYTIAANMHLGLLRDICLKGGELGLAEKTLRIYREKLAERIASYGVHVDRTVDSHLSDVAKQNPETRFNRNEP